MEKIRETANDAHVAELALHQEKSKRGRKEGVAESYGSTSSSEHIFVRSKLDNEKNQTRKGYSSSSFLVSKVSLVYL